jgi:uncharacterized membrane protein
MHYLPLTPGLFSVLVFLVVGLVILIQLRILRYAYMRLGVGPGAALLLLFGSLIGSYFNIPVAVLPGHTVQAGQIVDFFGMQYVVPLVVSSPGTVIAVNVGGAVIPTLMSIYLVIRYQLWLKAAIAIAAIAFIIHMMATPVHGIGIAVPVFAPVVTTAILAFILSREYAAPLAYIGGSMGTLIGADLLNLDKISGLGAPVASNSRRRGRDPPGERADPTPQGGPTGPVRLCRDRPRRRNSPTLCQDVRRGVLSACAAPAGAVICAHGLDTKTRILVTGSYY